jgi:hypothetical protein
MQVWDCVADVSAEEKIAQNQVVFNFTMGSFLRVGKWDSKKGASRGDAWVEGWIMRRV